MERLTEKVRNHDGTAISKKSLVIECGMKKGTPSGFCSAIVTKLAEYEDLEEQGKLIKLPCAVGDTVYIVSRGDILSISVSGIQIFLLDGELVTQIECTNFVSYGYMHFLTKEIGRVVFLTKESAEAALKEMSE